MLIDAVSRRLAVAAAAACLGTAPAAAAAALPTSPKLLYTTPEGFIDEGIEAAPTSDGFLLIFDRHGPSGEMASVRARRFDAKGEPLGGDIVIDAEAAGGVTYPDLLPLGKNRFLATWNHGVEVRAAFVDAAAATVGEAVVVAQNRYASFTHEAASLGSGQIAVVTRVARGERNEDTALTILDTGLNPVGKPSIVEKDKPNVVGGDGTFPTAEQTIVSVGAGAKIVYHAADNSMQGVAVDKKGKLGAGFPVSSTPGFKMHPVELLGFRLDALELPDGGFAVAWTAREQAGDQGFGRYDVRVRVFDADGTPRGADFLAHPKKRPSQAGPVLIPARGGFGVAYLSAEETSFALDVAVRFFDASGAPLTGEIVTQAYAGTANDPTPDAAPATVRLPNGSYASVYPSRGSVYADGFADPTKAP